MAAVWLPCLEYTEPGDANDTYKHTYKHASTHSTNDLLAPVGVRRNPPPPPPKRIALHSSRKMMGFARCTLQVSASMLTRRLIVYRSQFGIGRCLRRLLALQIRYGQSITCRYFGKCSDHCLDLVPYHTMHRCVHVLCMYVLLTNHPGNTVKYMPERRSREGMYQVRYCPRARSITHSLRARLGQQHFFLFYF